MKIVFLNDTHCGIRNSSEIFINYQDAFYNQVLFPYMLENGITQIIHLGDYYDNRRTINLKALNRNRMMFLNRLRELGLRMDIIPGNHDVYHKNSNALSALNELQGHFMDEVRIIEQPTVMNYDGLDIALIPWINSENEQETFDFLSKCTAPVCGAHLELKGFELHAGLVCEHGMDPQPFERFDMVLSGHFHTKGSKGNIHYLGSQMEFFWNDAHDPKYFHVLDTETMELEAVQNPLTMFEKIYYDDSMRDDWLSMDLSHLENKFVKVVVTHRKDNFVFDAFIDRINNIGIHELKIAESFAEFRGDCVDDSQVSVEDTTTLLNSYIDAVDTSLDKDTIKRLMHDLMIEAQSLEIA